MNSNKNFAVAVLSFVLALAPALSSCKKDKKEESQTPTPAAPSTTQPVVTQTIEGIATGSFANPQTAYFSFETGSIISASDSSTKKWDISFRRQVIRLNGGISGPGNAGLVIKQADYNNVLDADESGYKIDGEGPADDTGTSSGELLVFNNWFDYTNSSVEPKIQTYVIRTANGKFLKMEILSYYDPVSGAGGVYKFRYTYQPGGSKVLN